MSNSNVSQKLNWYNRVVELSYGDLTRRMRFRDVVELLGKHNITYDKTFSIMFNEETWLEIELKEVNQQWLS